MVWPCFGHAETVTIYETTQYKMILINHLELSRKSPLKMRFRFSYISGHLNFDNVFLSNKPVKHSNSVAFRTGYLAIYN